MKGGRSMEGLSMKHLYEKYKQDVFQYLYSLTHDISLAEDLTSETFLGALKSLTNFQGNSDIKTWLFSIARYQWYGYLRKKKELIPGDVYVAEQLGMSSVNIEHLMVEKELVDKMKALLTQEPEQNQEILRMRMEGYSYYEISKQMQISESSARVIEFRTKRKLHEQLRKEGFDYE